MDAWCLTASTWRENALVFTYRLVQKLLTLRIVEIECVVTKMGENMTLRFLNIKTVSYAYCSDQNLGS